MGHYRKIRKKFKVMPSVQPGTEEGSGVQDHRNFLSPSYKPPGCFTLTLMKKLFNKVSKMAFKYSGGRLHFKRTSNFHHLSVTAMETPSGHNSQSNLMSGWQLQYYRHTQQGQWRPPTHSTLDIRYTARTVACYQPGLNSSQ